MREYVDSVLLPDPRRHDSRQPSLKRRNQPETLRAVSDGPFPFGNVFYVQVNALSRELRRRTTPYIRTYTRTHLHTYTRTHTMHTTRTIV